MIFQNTPEDVAAALGWLAGIGSALYAAYTKFNSKAQVAAKAVEDDIQGRIDKAVAEERERCVRLREIAEEWKEIATSRKARNEVLEAQLNTVKEELSDLRTKYEEVLKLYVDSQKQLSTLQQQMEKLTKNESANAG